MAHALPLYEYNNTTMDRQIASNEQSKGTLKLILKGVAIIAVVVLLIWGFRKLIQKKGSSDDFHVVKVERGNILNTLSASGLVIASSERVINAPVSTEISEVLRSTGAEVMPGDIILKLDQEYTKLEYDKLNDELSLRSNSIDKLKLEFDKNLRELDLQDQIKALQLSELKAQVGYVERLFGIGGATQEEVEAAKLKLSISKLEKNILENELAYRRSVNVTEKKNLQLEFDIQAKRLKELAKKLRETQVTAPQKGVITWINEDIGKTVSEGEPLVKIANLNRYKIEATTSDRNGGSLQLGQSVKIRIGKVILIGVVDRILPEIINNTVKFYIALDDDDNEALRPSLRTEVQVITDEKADVLRCKRGNALKGTTSQYFFKVDGDQAKKVRVTKGLVSSDYFEVVSGLEVGDQVIISETEDFEHMDQFTITQD